MSSYDDPDVRPYSASIANWKSPPRVPCKRCGEPRWSRAWSGEKRRAEDSGLCNRCFNVVRAESRDAKEAILERIKRDEATGCWIWQGMVGPWGYGLIGIHSRRQVRVHRVAYAAFVGELLPGRHVHHRCGNKLCVNPEHLEQLTQSEHLARHGGPPKKQIQTHCKHGHEFTPETTRRYLLPDGKIQRSCHICHALRSRLKRGRAKARREGFVDVWL